MRVPSETSREVAKLSNSLWLEMAAVNETLSAAGYKNAGIRAKVRCPIGDLSSTLALYSAKSKDTTSYAIAVPSGLLTKYIISQTLLLTKTLMVCLSRLDTTNTPAEIKELIVSASILESIRNATLFSGSRYSFANELVWRPNALGLLESIERKNMLGFRSAVWLRGSFDFCSEEAERVDMALGRITDNDASIFSKLNICVQMARPNLSIPACHVGKDIRGRSSALSRTCYGRPSGTAKDSTRRTGLRSAEFYCVGERRCQGSV